MKIIYGTKGTGKTKKIIDLANENAKSAKGHVVFITDTDRYAFDLKQPIRFLNTSDFNVKSEDALAGFLKGIVAANADNEFVFVDGVARICDKPLVETCDLFESMEALEKQYGVKCTITCSAAKEDLPKFIVKYVD